MPFNLVFCSGVKPPCSISVSKSSITSTRVFELTPVPGNVTASGTVCGKIVVPFCTILFIEAF